MDRVGIGRLETSVMGLGCMGFSEFYGVADWDTSVRTIQHALERGVTLLDTADAYGAGHNEVLVGQAIRGRRDEVVLATKLGLDRTEGDVRRPVRGNRAFVRRSCDMSLLRLGVDVIDIYYLHRPPEDVPIEEAVAHLVELVDEGKVREIGLSNVDGDQLESACSVGPIAAVQVEYSLWARACERLVPGLRQHGIALVAYSPLGRGLLTGRWSVEDLASDDLRRKAVPTEPAARGTADAVLTELQDLAAQTGATQAQLALAWVRARSGVLGIPVIPIPGTKTTRRLDENVAALELDVSMDQLGRLDRGVVAA